MELKLSVVTTMVLICLRGHAAQVMIHPVVNTPETHVLHKVQGLLVQVVRTPDTHVLASEMCAALAGTEFKEFRPATNSQVKSLINILEEIEEKGPYWVGSQFDGTTDLDDAFSWTSEPVDTSLWMRHNGYQLEPDFDFHQCIILRKDYVGDPTDTGKHMLGTWDCDSSRASYFCSKDEPEEDAIKETTPSVTTHEPREPTTHRITSTQNTLVKRITTHYTPTIKRETSTSVTESKTKPKPTTGHQQTTTSLSIKSDYILFTMQEVASSVTESKTVKHAMLSTSLSVTQSKANTLTTEPNQETSTSQINKYITTAIDNKRDTTTTASTTNTIDSKRDTTTTASTTNTIDNKRDTTTTASTTNTIDSKRDTTTTASTTNTIDNKRDTTTTASTTNTIDSKRDTTTTASTTNTIDNKRDTTTNASTNNTVDNKKDTTTIASTTTSTTTCTTKSALHQPEFPTTTITTTTTPDTTKPLLHKPPTRPPRPPRQLNTVPVKVCPCKCPNTFTATNNTFTSVSTQQLTNEIQRNLTLNTRDLSKSSRKRKSANDDRPTSQVGGYIAIALLTLVFFVLLLFDLTRFVQWLCSLSNNQPFHGKPI